MLRAIIHAPSGPKGSAVTGKVSASDVEASRLQQTTHRARLETVMLNVDPEKWYSVKEVAGMLRVSVDTIRRRIYDKRLRAFIMPSRIDKPKRDRIYRCASILGADLIRFLDGNSTT